MAVLDSLDLSDRLCAAYVQCRVALDALGRADALCVYGALPRWIRSHSATAYKVLSELADMIQIKGELAAADEEGGIPSFLAALDAELRENDIHCPECGSTGFVRIPAEEYGDPRPTDWQKCDCHWGRQTGIEPPEGQ